MPTLAQPSPFSLFNENASANLLLVCEHASNFIPSRLQNLQIDDEVLTSHAALDIGALALAKSMSRLLDAPLVSTTISRLVYDCNRPCGAVDAIPQTSEIYAIPGNRGLGEADVRERFESVYQPFETAISGCLEKFIEPPLLVTVHSFTPVYQGEIRDVDIGMIFGQDHRLGEQLVALAPQQTNLRVEANQPYGPGDGVTHTLDIHGNARGLLNAMIEVNNSLLGSDEECAQMGYLLAILIAQSAEQFGYRIPLVTS